MNKCIQCEQEKELTVHGTCWKCHMGSISFHTRIEARKNTPVNVPTKTASRVKDMPTITID